MTVGIASTFESRNTAATIAVMYCTVPKLHKGFFNNGYDRFVEMRNTAAAIEAYRRALDITQRDYRAWSVSLVLLSCYVISIFACPQRNSDFVPSPSYIARA